MKDVDARYKAGFKKRQEELGVHWIPGTDPELQRLQKEYQQGAEAKSHKAMESEVGAPVSSDEEVITVEGVSCARCKKPLTKRKGRGRPPTNCLSCRGLI